MRRKPYSTSFIGRALERIAEEREEILAAFLSKYGCNPDEAEQVIKYRFGSITWYVRKKENYMNISVALEMARCVKINLENMEKMMPLLKTHPLLPIVKLQIEETIKNLEGDEVSEETRIVG